METLIVQVILPWVGLLIGGIFASQASLEELGGAFVWGVTIVLISLVPLASIGIQNPPEKACVDIGLHNYVRENSVDFCRDTEGNIVFIDLKCNYSLFSGECVAKRISVGDVRILAPNSN